MGLPALWGITLPGYPTADVEKQCDHGFKPIRSSGKPREEWTI
jgi:hypothetical protein